jgi:hypothetical protein
MQMTRHGMVMGGRLGVGVLFMLLFVVTGQEIYDPSMKSLA